jgi:hypothetical protein
MLGDLDVRPHHDDGWNRTVRGEEPQQRADRNFVELLQELRVLQTGVQILFALLLTVAFTEPFEDADTYQRITYVGALTSCALAAALLIAPVAYHRALFQRGRKRELVVATHRLLRLGQIMLLVAMVASLVLVADAVIGRIGGVVLASAICAAFVLLWFVLPARTRKRHALMVPTLDE